MEKIDIKNILKAKIPRLFEKYPKFLTNLIVVFIQNFLKIKEINNFIASAGNLQSFEFIRALFNELNFSYIISPIDKHKIPADGKLIIISNHPLGGLDGLALLQAVGEVRKDVKVVANDVLQNLENLSELFLPLDVYSMTKQKNQIQGIENALIDEQVVILFPAGKVSRLTTGGIKDLKWQSGAIRFSIKLGAPVLPIYVEGKNSIFFYLGSLINKNIGMFMLPQELFRKRNSSINIIIGDLIPSSTFKNQALKIKVQTKLLYQHVYKLKYGKSSVFITEKAIIPPIDRNILKYELSKSQLLGNTNDGMKIYLCLQNDAPQVLNEIARLREQTFRKVGEGTGKSMDIDAYDSYYKHIVLWDEDELEVVGSYRLGITKDILETYGAEGLYNSAQFTLSPKFLTIVGDSLEVGRSFIQQKYWRSNALDYIWQGIGAYLSLNPQFKYLWGAVSISNSYPELAKSLITKYYSKWYFVEESLAEPHNHYIVNKADDVEASLILNSGALMSDFRNLKAALKNMGLSIPVLYRRYIDLTEQGGSVFVSWCVNKNFNDAVDGLIIVDLSQLKDDVRKRYYNQPSFNNPN